MAASSDAPRSGLDKEGAAFPRPSKTVSRWKLKHQISQLLRADVDQGAPLPGVCKCGSARHDQTSISVVRRDGKAGFRGTLRCDSAWLCPTCAPHRAGQRVERLGRVFDAVEQRGWSLVFVTLTAAHRRQDTLEHMVQLVGGSSRAARQGRAWVDLATKHGIEGVIVGPEVTWSPQNGWHYHQHIAVIVATMDQKAAEAAGIALRDRYMAKVVAAKGRALHGGQYVEVVWRREDLQRYIAKGSAVWELGAAGTGKEGNARGLTPFALAAAAAAGDRQAAALFKEFARVMPGTRSCVITPQIAAKLGISPDDDTETEGVIEEEPEDEEVGRISRSDWHLLLRRGRASAILAAVQAHVPWAQVVDAIARWTERPPDPVEAPGRAHDLSGAIPPPRGDKS